jgi:uncharacterized protein (DUF885 family)
MSSTSQLRRIGTAQRIVDDAWDQVRQGPYVQQNLGVLPTRLPDLSHAEAVRRTEVGRDFLARLAAIDLDELPHDLALSLRLVRWRAQLWKCQADWYWTVCDPIDMGYFGMFLPTAYCGGFLLKFVGTMVRNFQFREPGDLDRYLALMADYARMVDQMRERTAGQAERGMRIPVLQIEQVRTLVAGFRQQVPALWKISPERLGGLQAAGFHDEIERRIKQHIEPAFTSLLGLFDDAYVAKAPSEVGLGQYPGGAQIYESLVRMHTTQDLSPQQVFEAGHARMAQIEAQMASVRQELGFKGDGAAFLEHVAADARWRAQSPAAIAAVFQRYIDRLKPRLPDLFRMQPTADYGVDALPEALQGSMTFGYYDAPRPDRNSGLYLFNSANLSDQPLLHVAALNYHELVPGHHLHLATQHENTALHPLRTHAFVNAYNEGWAEYAATLAGELGMYEAPEERYGRLIMDAFLTCRLVVDTGMNALGWSLEQARDYMRKHSGMSETEIRSETLRYSCDIPGQSLAYKLGDTRMLAMREKMRAALAERFDIRDFHDAVLGPGSLPLDDLAWHVDWETERLLRER